MTEDPEARLRSHLADALRRQAPAVTSNWIDRVAARLDVAEADVLPTAYLLDHIPECLAAIADYVEGPDVPFPTELLRDEMTARVHRRRQQGFGVRELLAEYEILSSLLQDFLERTVREMDFPVDPPALVAVVGALKDGFATFGLETARSYRIWTARERRERALQTTTFAAMMRHELRNRLGSAQTAAELLMEESVEPERRDRLTRLILRSLEQALDTVDVVTGIMSDTHGEAEPATWLPLGELLQGIVANGGGAPRIEVDLGGLEDVRVPGARVSMVLLNLVDNALKYHREEGRGRWVRVTAKVAPDGQRPGPGTEAADWLLVTVADNGPGIDPGLRESVFEFSVRGDDTESGSGLGLALSREIVCRLGGDMWLEDAPDAGTRIAFTLPCRRS